MMGIRVRVSVRSLVSDITDNIFGTCSVFELLLEVGQGLDKEERCEIALEEVIQPDCSSVLRD
jgi:hypothetical protein